MTRENLFSLLRGNSPQLIAVFFGTLNAFSDGMHFGWTAPTVPILQREDSPIKVTPRHVMLLEVYYMIFGIVGLPITVFLADKIGRQKSVLLASATSLVGWILIGIGNSVEYFIVARCLVGVAADVAFVCSPMNHIQGTLNALSDGMHFGWPAPTVPILQREDSPIKVTPRDVMLLEVYYMIFGIVGLPITVFLADKIGRQKSVLLASATSFVGWMLIGFGNSVEYFIVARCLVGVAADVAFVCSPMYVAEIAHPNIRGFLAGIIYTMVVTGVFVIYVIAPYTSIRIPPVVGGSIILIQLLVFPFMPESPYYHLYKNNEVAARKSLQKLRGTPNVEDELEEIAAAIERQKMEKGRLLDLFLVRSNRKALFIMTMLNCIQNMVGFSAILMNFHMILDEAGATYLDSQISAIIFAGIMVMASFGPMLCVDRFGRKKLYGFSCFFSGLSLLTIAIYYNFKYSGYDVIMVAWIPLVFLMLFAAFFKSGIGSIPIVMTAELFPARVKAIGMTAADGIFVLFASLSLYVFQTMNRIYGMHSPFYLFALVAFSGLIFDTLVLPETKNKTLEEIQVMLKS